MLLLFIAMKGLKQHRSVSSPFRALGLQFFVLFACFFPPTVLSADYIRPAVRDARASGFPDPFVSLDGSEVDTPEKWYDKRRNELKELFQYHMYGYLPPSSRIETTVVKHDAEALGGNAQYFEVRIDFPDLPQSVQTEAGERIRPRIMVSLFLPATGDGPFPVFVGINRCGNHTVTPYRGISIFPESRGGGHCYNSEEGRGTHTNFWSVEYVISRGYAFATFHQSDVDRDRVDAYDGIQPFYAHRFAIDEEHAATAWGTIAVWAWGVSRVIDFLDVSPYIDNTRIAVVGHSRRGKSALLVAAFDERIDFVIPHQAGTGAEALSRGLIQEPMFIMNRTYPHWFNDIYKSYDFRTNRLPVDQHELLALVAPRGVLLTAALDYLWAGPNSALRAMKAADPIFKLLGAEGLRGNGIIPSDAPITTENATGLSQYRRATGHRLDPGYWRVFVDYADAFYKKALTFL